jgi:hypothetical protein
MDCKDLCERYQFLLAENKILNAENDELKNRLDLIEQQGVDLNQPPEGSQPLDAVSPNHPEQNPSSILRSDADPSEKIQLFMSLFRGRGDVYAKRWQNRGGRSGYTPVCLNKWKPGQCRKPVVKCSDCSHKSYAVLDE